jgi:hypothetical protein
VAAEQRAFPRRSDQVLSNNHLQRFSKELTRTFALALGMDEHFFNRMCTFPAGYVRPLMMERVMERVMKRVVKAVECVGMSGEQTNKILGEKTGEKDEKE